MADRLTLEQRRLNMSRIRAKNTAPEWTVRRLLHSRGFRYQLHRGDLPGKPDIVLPRFRTAVFVHGCFWHGHTCSLFRTPATRTEFWLAKIALNRQRDATAVSLLKELGWRSLLIWECALKGRGRLPESQLAQKVTAFLNSDAMFDEIAEKRISPTAEEIL
ncbi:MULTISPECIES: very short patch repair endonuclease [Rhizobium]|uniref:very short patch repair endonuclease n=1 Tax=Rhizobium TaxID=379 RepID=UPI00163A47AC|nr:MULTISPECIES: very short patch repair endonuclease [Rhizobium]MBC2807022.1 DNA mismatch endonuclease Vsr [Rhizobium ruizarguesonis]MBX5210781.1 DNA mismatch endonuclease Vsr [Rhizobium sp. NZLR11]